MRYLLSTAGITLLLMGGTPLIVNLTGALQEETDLAFGNAVGFGFVLVVIPLFLISNARISHRESVALLATYVGYLVYRFSA